MSTFNIFRALLIPLALLVWWLLQQVLGNYAVGFLGEALAPYVGIREAQVIALLSQYGLPGVFAILAIGGAYCLGAMERKARASLEIIFDPNDTTGRYLVNQKSEWDPTTLLFVEVRNVDRERRTLRAVSLRIKDGEFSRRMALELIRDVHKRPRVGEDLVLFSDKVLNPGAFELYRIFGARNSLSFSDHDVWNKPLEFTLEAQAENTPAVQTVFQWDGSKWPWIRKKS